MHHQPLGSLSGTALCWSSSCFAPRRPCIIELPLRPLERGRVRHAPFYRAFPTAFELKALLIYCQRKEIKEESILQVAARGLRRLCRPNDVSERSRSTGWSGWDLSGPISTLIACLHPATLMPEWILLLAVSVLVISLSFAHRVFFERLENYQTSHMTVRGCLFQEAKT